MHRARRRRRCDVSGLPDDVASAPKEFLPEFRLHPFRPAWWLRGGHAQTLGGRWLRRGIAVPLAPEHVPMPDGDFVELAWAPGDRGADSPLVLVLHGLEGSAGSGYVLQTHRMLAERGVRSVGLNFRSCGPTPNRLPRFYHAGETGDLARVVAHLRAASPAAPLGAVGFSLGGNVLLKWLGETGASNPLRGAVAVSVPFDLGAGARALERGLGPLYTRAFLGSLRRKLAARTDVPALRCDLPAGRRAQTLRAWDDAVTAPLHGFAGVDDYHRRSSSAGVLPEIRVPTLILHATDDPFLPAHAVPRDAIRANRYLVDGVAAGGGHVGFVGGTFRRPVFWAEAEAARFLAHTLDRFTPAPLELDG